MDYGTGAEIITGQDRLDAVEQNGECQKKGQLVDCFDHDRAWGEDESKLVMEGHYEDEEEKAYHGRCHHRYNGRKSRTFAIASAELIRHTNSYIGKQRWD